MSMQKIDMTLNTILCLTWAERVLRLEIQFSLQVVNHARKLRWHYCLITFDEWRFSWVGIMAEKECACEKGSRDIICSLRFLYLRRRRSNSIPWCIFPEASRNIAVIAVRGGSVAEWSASRTPNPAVPGSSPARATCWICAQSSRSATLVNSQLVAFCQLGFLILLCCIWIICF